MLWIRGYCLPVNSETVNADFFRGIGWGVTLSMPLWALIALAVAAAR